MRKLEAALAAAILAGALICAAASAATPGALSLGGYLEQVRKDSLAARGAEQTAQGSSESADEGTLLLAPTLHAQYEYYDDRKPNPNPMIQGDHTNARLYSIGVHKLTSFGLDADLSYGMQWTLLEHANPLFVPLPQYYDASPTLTLTQSLWRNAFGALTRANQDIYQAQNLMTSYTQSYALAQTLASAETAYYQLALARETVGLERANLERALKMRDWNERRVKLQLADKTDLFQSEALYEQRQLELQGALDAERVASRAFNRAREVDSDAVAEQLAPVDPDEVLRLEAPARGERLDVKAAEQNERLAAAQAEVQLQTLSPDIQLFGSVAANGREYTFSSAVHDATTLGQPTWIAGVKLTAPLDLPEIFKSRGGQKLLQSAAAAQLERKRFEELSDWKDLERGFGEARRRLEIARALEKIQSEKLDHEKKRLSTGRTTTFQVLSFEQDYAAAQLARLRAAGDVLGIVAQMKTFSAKAVGGESR